MSRDAFAGVGDEHTRTARGSRMAAVLALRGLSLGSGYMTWLLAQRLLKTELSTSPFWMALIVCVGLLSAFFVFLAVLAPNKTVRAVWKAIGNAVLFILMVT